MNDGSPTNPEPTAITINVERPEPEPGTASAPEPASEPGKIMIKPKWKPHGWTPPVPKPPRPSRSRRKTRKR